MYGIRTGLSPSRAALALGLLVALVSELAMPAAQRTFVASTGDDATASSNCSLVLPCRSFATALTQTLDGGEIIVVDSAGYAPVVIDRSVSIIAPAGVYGMGRACTFATAPSRAAAAGAFMRRRFRGL
jgi:hypothetical protein